MPWIHFHVGDRGNVNACCVAKIPYGNVNTDSFDEIWKGEAIENLRDKFRAGQPDNRCKVCVNRELGGASSIRLETLEKFKHLNWEDTVPKYFDIRFSNVCNFKCRTCWHGASSSWFDEAQQLGRNIGQKAILNNINEVDTFISCYGTYLEHSEEIYFAGGEPLVTEGHYKILEHLIRRGAKKVRLRYNSNFSNLKFKKWEVLELWKYFESVEILASIDGVEEHGEYVRSGMDWQAIKQNREKIRSLSNVQFQIAPTVSVLNAFQLPRMVKKLIQSGFIDKDGVYFNLLERPYYYNIKCFPQELKDALAVSYQNSILEDDLSSSIQSAFQNVLSFMQEDDLSAHWKALKKETELMDRIRNESFELF